jgi:hypothetical protein
MVRADLKVSGYQSFLEGGAEKSFVIGMATGLSLH